MKTLFTVLTVLSLTWIAVAAPAEPDPAAKKADDSAKVDEPKKIDEPKKDELPAPKAAPEPVKVILPELVLIPGEASATPHKQGVAYANGGVLAVNQPNPTTIVVTLSGLAGVNADLCSTSTAGYDFDLNQCFEVHYDPKVAKATKLSIEGRVVGLLRTDWRHYKGHLNCAKGGTAETCPAVASISAGSVEVVGLTIPARSASCGDDLSVYNHEGALAVPVSPGKYDLHETWGFHVTHPAFCVRGASAEFSPEPAYYPDANAYWFHDFQPFNGSASKDFGFQVTIKLLPE